MKFNWGFGITAFIILFVGFMLTLVFKAGQQNHELATENYYEKELEFESILTKKENAKNAFSEPVKGEVKDNTVIISFPEKVKSNIKGSIYFFKPSKEDDDITFEINTTNNIQTIPLEKLASGMFKVKIDWQNDNEEYYNELTLVIP